MHDHTRPLLAAWAARTDIVNTLRRYFTRNDPDRAQERAEAMVVHYDAHLRAAFDGAEYGQRLGDSTARANLLNLLAQYGMHTRHGSRRVADRILAQHAHELAEKQLDHMRHAMDAELHEHGCVDHETHVAHEYGRMLASLIDPPKDENAPVRPVECLCGDRTGVPHEHPHWLDRSPRIVPLPGSHR